MAKIPVEMRLFHPYLYTMNMDIFTQATPLAQMLTTAMLAVLFLQSGLDKVFQYKGNLAYFRDHLKKSPLAKTVGLLMPVITFTEVAAGILSLVGLGQILLTGDSFIALLGGAVSGLALLMLFFGQRLAQDYAGAGVLVPYMLLCVVNILVCG